MKICVFVGFLISFGIRCNLGVAIVQMTANNTETGVKINMLILRSGIFQNVFC